MARIFDVVEYPSEMVDEIVHRFPETGVADLRLVLRSLFVNPRLRSSSVMVKLWMYLTRPTYDRNRERTTPD